MGLWQRFTSAGPLGMAVEPPEDPEAGVPVLGTELNGGVVGPAEEPYGGVLVPTAAPAEELLDGHKLVPVTGTTGVPLLETGVLLPDIAVAAGVLVPDADPPEGVVVLADEVEIIGVPVPDAEVEIAGVSVPRPVFGIAGGTVTDGDCVADAQAERTSANIISVENKILLFIFSSRSSIYHELSSWARVCLGIYRNYCNGARLYGS